MGRGEVSYADLLGDLVFPKDVAFDDPGLTDLGDIVNVFGHDSIAVVCFAIFGEEADEALGTELVDNGLDKGEEDRTEKAGMMKINLR